MPSGMLKANLAAAYQATGIKYTETGPALSFLNKVVEPAGDADSVCAGKCMSWPREAEGWIKRNCVSGWPTKKMRKQIASKGCHFVAKAHKQSKRSDLEFQFALVVPTKEILNQITPRQRQCYIIFKTLMKHYIPNGEFNTYCLKTIFMWSLEKIPRQIWDDSVYGLATCLLHLIDELMHGLINKNIPMYFMPTCNLLELISRKQLRENIRQICSMRKDLMRAVVDYDKNIYVLSLMPIPLLGYFLNSMNTIHGRCQTLKDCLGIYQYPDHIYLEDCLSFCMMHGALYTIQDMLKRAPIVTRSQTPNVSILKFMQLYLLQITDEHFSEYYVWNLASVCSTVYMNNTDTRCESFQKLIECAFRTALAQSQTLSNNAAYVYYGFFLMYLGRNDDAINVLKQGIVNNESTDMRLYEYFFLIRNHLDDILRYLLESRTYLMMPAHLMAYYLLIRLYKDSGKTRDAKALLSDFSLDCDRCSPIHGIVHCHILLAYSCLYLGEYWLAGDAFVKDLTLSRGPDRENIEKMWICRAMEVYFQLHSLS